jgi:hypothetical protein
MSGANVLIRGLFIVARHTDFNQHTGMSTTDAEPMSIVFPDPHHSHASGHLPHHAARIHFRESSLDPDTLKRLRELLQPAPQKFEHFVAFSLAGWTVELAPHRSGTAVEHEKDESVGKGEPTACDPDSFASLSRVPNLNLLTKGTFAVDLSKPSPRGVQCVMKLWSGKLVGVMSCKPLGRAYYEFFDNDGTVAVQRAVEDVSYDCPLSNGNMTLLFRLLSNPGMEPHEIRVTPSADYSHSIVVDSMPARDREGDDEIPPTLSHFFLYYDLMANVKTRPLLRTVAVCEPPKCDDKGHPTTTPGALSHLTPPGLLSPFAVLPGVASLRARFSARRMSTETGCPCLVAQVFIK